MPRKAQNSNSPANILDVLTEQHEQIDELFEQLESGKADRDATFAQLADLLAAHATSEENVFYPGIMRAETAEILHESVEEHLSVKRLVTDLLALDPAAEPDEFDAKISVLKEQVSHHAHEEEEDKLFPILRKLLDDDELADLATDFLVMFESVIDRDPRYTVPDEIGQAAPLPST